MRAKYFSEEGGDTFLQNAANNLEYRNFLTLLTLVWSRYGSILSLNIVHLDLKKVPANCVLDGTLTSSSGKRKGDLLVTLLTNCRYTCLVSVGTGGNQKRGYICSEVLQTSRRDTRIYRIRHCLSIV